MRKTILLLLPVMMLLAGCGDNPEEKAQQLAQAKLEIAQQELELRAKELELKEKELAGQQTAQQAAPAVAPAAAPVVVNSGGGDSGMTDVLLGAAVGGLVANALNTPSHSSYSAPQQQIVHKTVIKKTVYQKPKPYKRPVTNKKLITYKPPRPVVSSYKPKRY